MANTYESKFKGVEVDEGVNIARNLTGTGGIEVKKTATGTINATVIIDGSGVKITPVSGTGTSTTDVMSQKAVTDELGKKQDKITDQTSLNVGALTAKGYSSLNGIYVDNSTTNPICFKRNGGIVTKMYGPTSGGGELVNVYLPGKGGTLALTSDIPTGSGGGTTITVNGKVQSALKAAIYPDSFTGGVGDEETIALFDEYGGLNCADFSADYCYVTECTAQTSAQKNYRTTIQPTGIYFEWTGGSYPDLDEGSNKTLTLCAPLSTSTTSGNVIRLPAKSGTVALLSDITGGGGSAGVSSIGGQTGAITLGTGLTIDGNNVLDVITHMNYVNMYLHRIIGKFDRSSGSYAIMISVYNGTEAEFTGDTLGDLIQQLFEYQYTSSIVIAKTDGPTVTSWDPTKFEQLYVGTIVDGALYCNFNEMNIVPVQLYDIPFVMDIVEQIALPVS